MSTLGLLLVFVGFLVIVAFKMWLVTKMGK